MQTKQKIIQFLNRNVILDDDVIYKIRSSIDELSETKLNSIFEVLSELDQKQTELLQEKLKENPFFFFEIETKVFKEMLEKHLQEEKSEKEMIEKWILEQLK